MKSLLIAAALAVGLLGVSLSPTLAAPTTVTVHIQNFAFNPNPVTIQPGDRVEWINEDDATHDVVLDDGSGVKSPNLAKGGTFSHTFEKAGTVAYHCSFHRAMKASIVVK